MTGRLCLLGFAAGSACVQTLAALPGQGAMAAWALPLAALACVVLARCSHLPYSRSALLVLAFVLAGFVSTVWRAEQRLSDRLAPSNENRVTRVLVRVMELPRLAPDSRQFMAEVLSSVPAGVPRLVQVAWRAPGWNGPYGVGDEPHAFPDILPGQLWRMALTLKTPVGLRNPDGFDYEGLLFARGVRATGAVRGTPRLEGDEPFASLTVAAERARHHVRQAMLPYLEGRRYGAVLLALAIGDQNSVSPADWDMFKISGIVHLVSISGSHITLIAALGGFTMLFLWRRLSWRGVALAERCPARVAAALTALAVAWAYCLLAGWGVPARRTFFMLAVLALAYVARLPLDPWRLLSLVAFVVVLLDPWSVLSSGFWLSFGAVYVLMSSAGWFGQRLGVPPPAPGWPRRREALGMAARLQMAITLALVPLLALWFNDVSVVSPLVNAYAIPVISFVVTPLSLLVALFSLLLPLGFLAEVAAWLGHGALQVMMWPTVALALAPFASITAASSPWPLAALALAGVVLACHWQGLPWRHWGWALMLPALLWSPARPRPGDWSLQALDVGQGSAVVIETAQHTVLVDTGVRSGPDSDAGVRVVAPYLRSRGVRALDAVVVSHADLDHAGGLSSVLQGFPVRRSWASFPVAGFLEREARLLQGQVPRLPDMMLGCSQGQGWEMDGVRFEFLWPAPPTPGQTDGRTSAQRNAQACVLRIQGKHHSALLPGDIAMAQEDALVALGLLRADVVLAPHHGSRFSSGAAFVAALAPAHVIVQSGAWNRYGHPAPAVVQRWGQAGARVWRNDRQGAVQVRSREGNLQVRTERGEATRYWQWRMPERPAD